MEKGQLQYEEIRRKRLEENKKKLEDLNLTHLLHSLRNASSKPTHAKKGKPRPVRGNEANVEVRRSSRVANMPSPDYTGATVYYGEGTRTRRRLVGAMVHNCIHTYSKALLQSKSCDFGYPLIAPSGIT
eukprot:TRINITY_DN37439_c0_g1_i3.p1 TRINITY_DN37439_c0_g1~~TRINITY_DN37439_c0_g1_i3.p1  ORF type:complete len:129 (+),score=26.71 TRINITY_DN37439_c0_g1_i3:178-564(+)